eukprot:CFRG3527T1
MNVLDGVVHHPRLKKHYSAPILAKPPGLGSIMEDTQSSCFSANATIEHGHDQKRQLKIEKRRMYIAARQPFRTRCLLTARKLAMNILYLIIGLSFGMFMLLIVGIRSMATVVVREKRIDEDDDEEEDMDDDNIGFVTMVN